MAALQSCFHRHPAANTMSQSVVKIRALAVDDHPLLRDGIAALIADETDMALVGEAADGREAVERFRSLRPDVTLMDLQMPNVTGVEATIAIRAEFPDARIVVLTTYTGDVQVPLALKAGASGYLLKKRDSQRTAVHDPGGSRREKGAVTGNHFCRGG
jgi:DNA-binding NarL/FixJ family response regulator